MIIAIPKELQQAVRESQGQPIHLADPETKAEYVMLPAEVYDRLSNLIYDDNPLTDQEKQALLIKAGLRAGWNDPEMDVYDELDPRGQK